MNTTARFRAHQNRNRGSAVFVILLIAASAYAQIWTDSDMWRGWRGEPPRFATRALKDGRFHFCRLMYPSAYREAGGQGWRTDYPGADINFSVRLAELTKTAVGIDGEGEGDPEYFVVRSSGDDNLFNCPFVHIEDAGTAQFSDADVAQLRTVPAEGRVHVERRFLGFARMGSVGARDWARPATRALSDRRHPRDARDVPDRLQRQAHPAGARDQPLAATTAARPQSADSTARW